jgi:hypothetical protein
MWLSPPKNQEQLPVAPGFCRVFALYAWLLLRRIDLLFIVYNL